MGLLSAAAGRAEVPVFPVVGVGGRQAAEALWLMPGIRVVDSPRAAVLLVVVGRLTRALLHPTMLVHDQLPGPRATLWWPGAGGATPDDGAQGTEDLLAALPDVVTTVPGDTAGLLAVFADLLSGRRPSGRPALVDVEYPRWRGVGPHGHGGEGMMGGVPFGRPLAEMADDPDGLMLDQLPLRVGPFFPAWPPGLILDVGLQGDVLRGVAVGDNPYRSWPGDEPVGPLDTALFLATRTMATTVAALEVARARHHLRWLSRTLRGHGLAARAQRVGALAQSLSVDDRPVVEALARRLGRDAGLAAATSGVGIVDRAALERVGIDRYGGPVARAAGLGIDARTHDPAYADLGFAPVIHHEGDARARLRQRAAEAAQALSLAERAGEIVRPPGRPVEGPRGVLAPREPLPSSALLALLPDLLDGLEWGDAVTTVASLDLDLEEAALDQSVATWPARTSGGPTGASTTGAAPTSTGPAPTGPAPTSRVTP